MATPVESGMPEYCSIRRVFPSQERHMHHPEIVVPARLVLGLVILGVTLPAPAEEVPMEKAEAAIKYRQNVMSAMGGLAGVVVGQLRDGFSYGPDLKGVAAALGTLSTDIPALFPTGTDIGETKAKAEVWSRRQQFEEAASKAKEKIAAFADAVDQGDRGAIFGAFKGVGDACKGCHDEFRKED
jgi:cytochrome c556